MEEMVVIVPWRLYERPGGGIFRCNEGDGGGKTKSRFFDSPPPTSTPKSKDRSLGTPELKSIWGPFPHLNDEDLSPGTPARSG